MAKRPRGRGPLESDEQRQMLRVLDLLGFVFWTTSEGRAVWRDPGLPDVYAYHPERDLALWLEAKRRRGGRISPEQQAFRDMHQRSRRVEVLVGSMEALLPWLEAKGFVEGGFYKPDRGLVYARWHEVRTAEKVKRELRKKARKSTAPPGRLAR